MVLANAPASRFTPGKISAGNLRQATTLPAGLMHCQVLPVDAARNKACVLQITDPTTKIVRTTFLPLPLSWEREPGHEKQGTPLMLLCTICCSPQ